MSKLKKIIKNWRVLLLITFIVFALVALRPEPFNDGVVIRAVMKNSSASLAGMQNPQQNSAPLAKEKIVVINNAKIKNLDDYSTYLTTLKLNQSFQIRTNKGLYKLVFTGGDIGLVVDEAPKTNLRKGLDLQGGTRVLLVPAEKVDESSVEALVDNLQERLNVYGLSDVRVTSVTDKPAFLGEPNRFILVEMAGATEEEVRDLLSKQGKFEAKIANKTVFRGGEDITYVCRTAECSGIDPNRACGQVDGGWVCGFSFAISITPTAAQRQAELTKDLEVVSKNSDSYLSEPIILFLDDTQVDSLNIAADLKARAVTEIAITGSGSGISEQEAVYSALNNMKRLQTILITGSLPVKLEISKIDEISPLLGKRFVRNAVLAGLFAILAVVVCVFIFYRKLILSIPIIITSLSEILLLLGFAALVGWNIDLSAIAGIIIAIGSGIDHQIIITDETLRKERSFLGWKARAKSAFFIIFSAYFTTLVAMVPLLFAGAGLLKGFALVTIAGLSFGVLITRPAFAAILQILFEE